MGYLNYQLNEDEDLIGILRKHWITLALPTAKVIVSLLLARVVYQVVQDIPYGSGFILIWILASILYLVHAIWIWYLNCYIITDQRIVDIDQKGTFRRQVAEIELGSIQEAVYETDGPLEALFNYGTVIIKTSSSGSIIAMEQVPAPEKVKKLISKIQDKPQ